MTPCTVSQLACTLYTPLAPSASIPWLVYRKNKVESPVLLSMLQHPALPASSSYLGHVISWDQRKGYLEFLCAVRFFLPPDKRFPDFKCQWNKPLSSHCKYCESSARASMSRLTHVSVPEGRHRMECKVFLFGSWNFYLVFPNSQSVMGTTLTPFFQAP